ncbi:MAG: tRNA preQ1(34) S-adenosylmethionine ribosyltransferase-isomerase QueA [Ignavibacteria bacterium]|jgi:S-adenosylmethionine:tRNA ribosyltransferase-isomerase|nr:tRNA preQ1(34) S-adenosylmethionine ribosyltransferase-isomerase QueA [Ignavibacteria bacterium]
MKLSEFKFNLPKNSVAKFLSDPRDSSRLMVLDKETGEIEEKQFKDIIGFMEKGDCLVVNETKVFPARLYGKKEKTNATIEVLLLRELKSEEKIWDVLVEPARKVRIGNKIYFDDERFYCEVIDNTTSRGRTVRFSYPDDLFQVIKRIGQMPIPELIKREPSDLDKETYQTIFANEDYLNSIAPPTAGLHFTEELLEKIEKKGIRIAKVVLNLGQGVFEKIEVEDLTKHRMYSEYFKISLEAAETINKSLKAKRNVFAVGASVVRALEASVLTSGAVKPNKGWTDKFIYPQYDFKIVNKYITNFQAPATSTLLLSAAFAGKENLMKAYRKAIKENFQFLAYGDALLIV